MRTRHISDLVTKTLLAAATVTALDGCGMLEKQYDQANYESLTNERIRRLELYSGGEMVKEFENVRVLYSDSDSFALWFVDSQGDKHYWQGEAFMDF